MYSVFLIQSFQGHITFTFVQHHPIVYQHLFFGGEALEFRPLHCQSSRKSYKSPFYDLNIVQLAASAGFQYIFHSGKVREGLSRACIQVSENL